MSSIKPMLGFLRDLKNDKADEQMLREILNHPDYDFEFRRYEIESKEPFIKYFMQLSTINETDIPEIDTKRKTILRDKHKKWLSAYENLEHYEMLYDKIKSSITDDTLEGINARVKRGLPGNTAIDDVRIISTMSIGPSFGYVFDGALHFDLMGFEDDSLDTLPSLIAHETHHLAMWKYVSAFIENLTLEERYIFQFTGEGLAIKFCNNAQGAISKAIDADCPINEGLDAFSIAYLNERFDEDFEVFEDTLDSIRAGKMDKDTVFKQFEEYWWNPYTDEQSRDEEPLLKQSRMYTFGNDLFGAIYDAHGNEKLFECVRNPLQAVEYFKQIIEKR